MSDPNPRPIPPPPPIQPPPDEPERKGAGTLVWILLLIALLAFGWYFFNQRGTEAPPTAPEAPPAADIGSEQEAAAERERQAAAERETRDAAAEPGSTVAADRDPAPLTRVEPEYPVAAARAREEGTVLVMASIDAQGKPVNVIVTRRSGSRELDSAAIAAVRQWTFTPALRGGQPAASQVEVPVEFSLGR